MRMSRRLIFSLGILALAVSGCSRPHDHWSAARDGQKRVLVTFPPLYCLTQAIAGEDAYVLCYLTGNGPHDATFSPQDAVKVRGADLVIMNGLELDEHFMTKLIRSSGNRDVATLEVGEE